MNPTDTSRLAFQAGTGPLVVQVAATDALGAARHLFPDHQVPPGDGAVRFALTRDAEGYHLSGRDGAGRDGTWSGSDVPSILARLELTLAETLVLESGFTGIHASGVLLDGGAVLFTGAGGCGKSSLAAALAMRGLPVFGDDVVLTDGAGVLPFQRLFKVEEPARTLLGLPEGDEVLAQLWPEASFYHPTDLGSSWAEEAPFRAVILPHRTGGTPTLEPVAPATALAVMFTGVVLRERLGTDDFTLVADVLERTPCYVLRFEETAAAAALVAERLG